MFSPSLLSSAHRGRGYSREHFDMDTEDIIIMKRKGLFLTWPKVLLLVLAVGFVVAVVVGLSVFFWTPRNIQQTGTCVGELAVSSTSSVSSSKPKVLPSGMRLSRRLIPTHYKVELQPRIYGDDADFGFNGSVVIDMFCAEATNVIVLHSLNLTIPADKITLSRIKDGGTTALSLPSLEKDLDRQFVKFHLAAPLVANATYRLGLAFNGSTIHDDWGGLYRSSYVEDGVVRWLVATQFEPSDARCAFPCFDEPSFKATFDIILVRAANFSSISNMEKISEEMRPDNMVADVYKTTVKMSTYMLAFVVSQFKYKEARSPKGHLVRLWARPKFIDYVDYALNITGPTLDAFIDYTGIDYPLNKTDHIALPNFRTGAMENWGLVTYRETALLINDNYSTTSSRHYVLNVIAHESAHMWWGNLVTCEWWDETWLNEGFANNYANVIAAVIQPTWKLDEYYTRVVWQALKLDESSKSQPVHIAGIEHHDVLLKAFDAITYRKGGSIIRMMKYFLSEETFQRGISMYLKRHAYGNVRREDLYKALEEQAVLDGKVTWDVKRANFTDIIESWIVQVGHPLVTVTDFGNGTIKVDQAQFLVNALDRLPPSPLRADGLYSWYIPLTFADKKQLSDGNSTMVWIYAEKSVLIEGAPVDGWKLVNILQQGFYRVHYSASTWQAILQQLKQDHTVFPVENRGQLINDAFHMAEAGVMSEMEALRVTEYLVNETAYLPIFAGLLTRLKRIEGMMYYSETQAEINKYVSNLVRPAYDQRPWDSSNPEESIEKYSRIMIIRENCYKYYKPCLDKAAALYAKFMASPQTNPIHPDFRRFVYCTAIAIGGVDEFRHALQMLNDLETTSQETFAGSEGDYLRDGLACVRQPWLISEFINYSEQKNDRRMLISLAKHPEAQAHLWDLIPYIVETSLEFVGPVLDAMTTYWSTDLQVKKVEDMACKLALPSGDTTFTDVIDRIKKNAKWLAKNEKEIQAWLMTVNKGRVNLYSQSETIGFKD